MSLPSGILQNTSTGRFHPILFGPAPMPGNADADLPQRRYKSAGHHTAGFDTLDQAKAEIVARGWWDCGSAWEWNGEAVPAMVEWFGAPPGTKSDAV